MSCRYVGNEATGNTDPSGMERDDNIYMGECQRELRRRQSASVDGAGWRLVWVLQRGGEIRELYSTRTPELEKLRGQVPEEQLKALRGALKEKYQGKTPPEVMRALEAAFGKAKINTREPTGSYNPGKTNARVNQAGKGMKYGGRVFLVFMVYDEYRKISTSDDWVRQLGSSSSGVLGAIGGGSIGGAATGAALGACELNPFTVAAGAGIGGIVGGVIGYNLFSGGFEALFDVLYE